MHLSKFSSYPFLRSHSIHSIARVQTRTLIYPFTQKQFTKISNYNYINLKLMNLSYRNSVTINKFSSMKKSESVGTSNKVDSNLSQSPAAVKINQRTKLKQAVRDYGATIIVFHVAISLASLGICYLAISNGVDAIRLLTFIGFSESVISSKVAVGGSTFVIAYAVHKLFAPVRIGITLSVAPFIVRYLRKINWLKSPVKKI